MDMITSDGKLARESETDARIEELLVELVGNRWTAEFKREYHELIGRRSSGMTSRVGAWRRRMKVAA